MTLKQYQEQIRIKFSGYGHWDIFRNGKRIRNTNNSLAIDRIKSPVDSYGNELKTRQSYHGYTLKQAYQAITE